MTEIKQNNIRIGYINSGKAYLLQSRAKALRAMQMVGVKHTVLLGRVELAKRYFDDRFLDIAFRRMRLVS